MSFRIELLNPSTHDRKSFSSGVESLDIYLQRFAHQNYKKGIATTHVLASTEGDEGLREVAGYYALSASQLSLDDLSEDDRKQLPRYPVPAIRMGQLAVDERFRGRQYGQYLVADAVVRCLKARETALGAAVMFVDALDETAAAFYEHYGFTKVAADPMVLYLMLGKP